MQQQHLFFGGGDAGAAAFASPVVNLTGLVDNFFAIGGALRERECESPPVLQTSVTRKKIKQDARGPRLPTLGPAGTLLAEHTRGEWVKNAWEYFLEQ